MAEEQKKQCAEKIADAIAETMNCSTASVSVAIREIPEKDWKAEVWDKSIAPDMDTLYKTPGYTCDEP